MLRPLGLAFLCLTANAENWPQWRGPGGNGVSSEKNLPLEWSATKNVAWSTEIPGRGHSSPVVWDNRIFLTTALEGDPVPGAKPPVHMQEGQPFRHPDSTGVDRTHKLIVLSLDTASGRILWQRTAYDGPVYDERHKKNTYATPTPVTGGKAVYVSFESQGVYSYSFDGKLRWKASLGNIGTVGMGPASSPILFNNLVILLCDQEEGAGSFIAALSAATGRQVWKTPRQEAANWSTPILVQHAGQPVLIAPGMKNTIAYDPRSGKELWRTRGVVGNTVPSIVSGLGMVFPSAGYPDKRVYGVKTDGAFVWSYEKGAAYVPSPILYGDYLYVTTDRGLLTCIEARTGKVIYEGKRVPKPATFSASPIAYDGRIFLSSEDGDVFVVKAGPEHEVLGTNSLDEPLYASPAISGGRVYFRGVRRLFAIGQ
ncbi:MAG: PQQ-binding-like beta-propeller repeat protein [Candidatus Solibacter usitatus]|nr:PQQ-binding-like beta-propeller repeat protein [Candidatus Solibacter usitatus]